MGPIDAIAAEDKSDLASLEVQSGKGKESLGERSKGSDDKDRPIKKSVGEFRKTCHPRNVEVYEIREISFQES
jgi:hypothetical protein